ncbi:MAG: hypothetical protein ALECFALPRED_006529 [Alectoria fallacina]|uniref:C2H2 type master regulator of conidiophore development brlA n=1 Tax=Alectoria fallacina TaxID=1903189 RepID=A0A8H3G340_9LECA|nr:MAG: hypothetical protein ALECFALPRED_006529 [Alectoria fallacina]
MYGEDSSGRRVSLLNDSSSNNTTTTKTTFSRPNLPDRSRLSSSSISSGTSRDDYNSSHSTNSSGSPRQTRSPPTPQLVRRDSQSSLSQSTPSPMTPSNTFDVMDSQQSNNKNYSDLLNGNANSLPYYPNPAFGRSNGNNGYPTLHEAPQQPYYNLDSQQPLPSLNGYPDELFHQRGTLQPLQTQLQHPYSTTTSPILPTPSSAASTNTPSHSLPPISTTTKADPNTPITTSLTASQTATANGHNATASKNPPMKKKYPCPHAVRHNCTDTFTTSGHAARHGKKHTGEKNILCPTCKKAFTRKDNMKQHERTHRNPNSKSGSVAGSPVIGSAKGSRRASASAGADAMDVDSDGSGMGLEMPKAGRLARPKMQRSELSEIMEGLDRENGTIKDEDADADGEGESPGLDALATAASEMS